MKAATVTSTNEKTVRTAARSVVDIASQLLLDLDEVDCPHCDGNGQTGLVRDLCTYCGGSCVVSEERAEEYNPDDLDEVECPHCKGRGQTGLVGDFCKLCEGQTVVSRTVFDCYEESFDSH